jgi:hypothetical protein
MFGMYVPRLFDGTLILRLALLATLAVILVHHLRKRHGAVLAAVFVGAGWILAVILDITLSVSFDQGGFGDICRESNHVNLPDWFWSLYVYFDVARGAVVSFLGIVCGAVLLAASSVVKRCLGLKVAGRDIPDLAGGKGNDTAPRG